MARQRGAALVLVLMILAVATLAATTLASSSTRALLRAERQQRQAQASAYAAAVEQLAINALRRDYLDDGGTVDSTADLWAQPVVGLPIEGGQLSGRVIDQSGRLNLNMLVDDDGAVVDAQKRLYDRLLVRLKLDPALADVLIDAIDPDVIRQPLGAERADQMRLRPPRSLPDQPLVELSELYALRGYDVRIVNQLAPYVTVLPRPTAININTAPALLLEVMTQLGPGMVGVLRNNDSARFTTLQDFVDQVQVFGGQPPDVPAVVHSEYFLVEGQVQYQRLPLRFSSLLERRSARVVVLWRTRG